MATTIPENAIDPVTRAGWRAWLAKHHRRTEGDRFPPSNKRGILEWIASAKKEKTRSRRIRETARLAASNERANQWRK